ncbi:MULTISPECIES: IclR family transcriptional regulator [Fusobacterium]|uniref:IclR family transcriptional regulator n=1 Tax=Fusobacterium TaxID=848 RepID=UPI0014768903|nr:MULTISPECIES: IclR family transcriptional regulator [Fusobacterium]NME35519.1 IclR family transcriptional regulator [Fusobacterium sp. FSA-380-WT-3A]
MENIHKPTERVINILNIIAKNSGKLTFSNISKLLVIPKSTLSPILKTLTELEVIILDPSSQTYSIGLSSFQIGQAYLENKSGLNIIKSHMRIISEKCNETCQLGINHNHEVLYLTKVESSHPIKLLSSIGHNLPLYCTALGRVFLMDYSESAIRNLYLKGLEKFTQNTVDNIDDLINIINISKKNQFASEFGEVTSDACCIAVPIYINNNIRGAIGVSLSTIRATEEHITNIKLLLKEHSSLITKEFEELNIKSIV